ncbi:DUF3558 family protein [Nocardia sp. XZ_19_385]|uniref:DUF3558 family protein n=1 Tax=Nocardia sp. XZ_19_385 TaxID=2769488 RepID=UPI00188EF754|nr:DUF3558 family protein [Nocardia sp. XZ_19_385]
MSFREGRRLAAASAVLLVSVGLAGCGRGTLPQYEAGFSQLPADCTAALKPAEQAIKVFAGEAYSRVAEFQNGDRGIEDTSQHLNCAMKFGGSVLREPVQPVRAPMWRNVSVSYYLSLYPIQAEQTTSSLLERGSSNSGNAQPKRLPGTGEDAITWVKAADGEPPQVNVEFRVGNLSVHVKTTGKDWSGVPETFPVVDSPELRADLQAGAESIAKAVARHAPSALPTAVLTRPSLTRRASEPTTTKAAAAAVWDPCEISQESLTAAGLDVESRFTGDKSGSSRMCMWRGEWFRLRVFSSEAPFEWSVYRGSTYVRPKPVTIGDRHAVQVHWDDSDLVCVLAFELPVTANLPDAGGRTLTFEASLSGDRSRNELCDELIRVANVVEGSLPPTT